MCERVPFFRFQEFAGCDEHRFRILVFDKHLLAREAGPDDFDGHALDEFVRTVLIRLIDDAHATLKYFAGDLRPKIALNAEERHAQMVGNCPAMSSSAHGGH